MWWTGDASWGAGQWIAMTVGMMLFWGLIALLVFVLIRSLRTSGSQPTAIPDQILAERFARGEIDAAEYTARRAALHGHAPRG